MSVTVSFCIKFTDKHPTSVTVSKQLPVGTRGVRIVSVSGAASLANTRVLLYSSLFRRDGSSGFACALDINTGIVRGTDYAPMAAVGEFDDNTAVTFALLSASGRPCKIASGQEMGLAVILEAVIPDATPA